LKDGETNFLAGLIRTDETNAESGLPGLSDIPVLGRLFGKTTVDVRRTDVMLTLTPHIIRTPDVTAADLAPIWVGTEANLSFRGGSPRVESEAEGPFDGSAETQELLEQRIREQVDQLPAGLRQQPIVTPGDDSLLSPASGPRNIFAPPEAPAEDFKPEPPEVDGLDSSLRRATDGDPLALIPTAASYSAAPSVALHLEPSVVSVRAGDRFQVAVEVDARVPISRLPSTLRFDPGLLVVEAVEAGDFLGGEEAAEAISDGLAPGELVVGASRFAGDPGIAGRGRLALITFRAFADGEATLELSASGVLDGAAAPVAGVEATGAAVEVRPARVDADE